MSGEQLRQLRVNVPHETYERLTRLAKAAGTSVDEAARYAIIVGFQVLDGVRDGSKDVFGK